MKKPPAHCHDTILEKKKHLHILTKVLRTFQFTSDAQHRSDSTAKMGDTRFANLKIRTSHKIIFGAQFDEYFLNMLRFLPSADSASLKWWNGCGLEWKRENCKKKVFSFRMMVFFIVSLFCINLWCRSICDPSETHTSCYTLLSAGFFNYCLSTCKILGHEASNLKVNSSNSNVRRFVCKPKWVKNGNLIFKQHS